VLSNVLVHKSYHKQFINSSVTISNGPVISPTYIEGNKLCIMYTLKYGCYHGLEPVL